MTKRRVGLVVGTAAAATAITLGGTSLALAQTDELTSSVVTTTDGTGATDGTDDTGADGTTDDTGTEGTTGAERPGGTEDGDRDCSGGPGGGGSQDTAVTGDEADRVIAAVQELDPDAEITEVRMDPDGSYDAIGTSGGDPVFYDVSADLSTVTEAAHGTGGRGERGTRAHDGTAPDGATDGSTDGSSDGGVSSGDA